MAFDPLRNMVVSGDGRGVYMCVVAEEAHTRRESCKGGEHTRNIIGVLVFAPSSLSMLPCTLFSLPCHTYTHTLALIYTHTHQACLSTGAPLMDACQRASSSGTRCRHYCPSFRCCCCCCCCCYCYFVEGREARGGMGCAVLDQSLSHFLHIVRRIL